MNLVLGTAQFDSRYGAVRRDSGASEDAAHAILIEAARLGFVAVDTAPAYGAAEECIGRARLDVAIHTKIDPALDPDASLSRSLHRLARPNVAILYFHDPGIARSDPAGLIDRGFAHVGHDVGRLGVSVYEPAEFEAAISDGRFGAVQIPLNLLDRRIPQSMFAAAEAGGIEVYARSALLQGVLVADPGSIPQRLAPLRPFVEDVHRLALEVGCTPLQLALGFVRGIVGIRGVVLGVDRVSDLVAITDAWRGAPLEMSVLERITEMRVPVDRWVDPRLWPQ